jgi:hypothetical protein
MTLTPMRKPEACPVVCVKLFLSLDASSRLHKNDTCAPSSYTPLLLLSHPTRIPCDSRVYKLAILKIRVTRVVKCVRQTFLRYTLTRRGGVVPSRVEIRVSLGCSLIEPLSERVMSFQEEEEEE